MGEIIPDDHDNAIVGDELSARVKIARGVLYGGTADVWENTVHPHLVRRVATKLLGNQKVAATICTHLG